MGEAERLLERARAMRAEIATLEGKTVDQVEAEAQEKRQQRQDAAAAAVIQKEEQKKQQEEWKVANRSNGSFLTVPETFQDQVTQAKAAVERAYQDGQTTQTIRFALLPEGEMLNEDRQWPGGAQQMYRSAAGPLTRELLRQLRPNKTNLDDIRQAPTVTSKDIWDFDGSAMITSEGNGQNVQAMVLPNTDVKYVKDIGDLRRKQEQQSSLVDQEGESNGSGLFVLVNPFWRNVDSWGFNLLAPNAKNLAQQEIFDDGLFPETYVLLQKSVRGEDCIALKAYPYDWQLYAYADNYEYYGGGSYVVRLGSTKDEPTASDFAKLLDQRDEFKLSKNMRQMQRMLNRDQ